MLKRILTAIVLLAIMWALLFELTPRVFQWVSAVILLLAAWGGSLFLQTTLAWRLGLVVLVALGIVAAFFSPIFLPLGLACAFWLWALVGTIVFAGRESSHAAGLSHPVAIGAFAVVALPAFWIGVNVLRMANIGPLLLLFVFALVWMVDIGGYFVGSRFGKHLLAPRVSPGKTWEGFFGGILLSLLLAVGVMLWLGASSHELLSLLPQVLVTALFAVLGDLFESLLKRQAKLKDVGNILPGHGGFLDRIDSSLAAIQVFTLLSLLSS